MKSVSLLGMRVDVWNMTEAQIQSLMNLSVRVHVCMHCGESLKAPAQHKGFLCSDVRAVLIYVP
jgi:tRNA(Ile2) C34 agmatinyltransferase TiaS